MREAAPSPPYSEGAQIPDRFAEKTTDQLIASFLFDLENPRSEEEHQIINELFESHVREEQARLQKNFEKHEGYSQGDIILGDAPYETKYDKLGGPAEFINIETATEALVNRFYNIWILNHPSRIAALKTIIDAGYNPPVVKDIPVLDEANRKNKAVDFEDLGLAVQEPDPEQDIDESARVLLSQGPFTWVADNLVALPYILSSMPDVSNYLSIATHVLCGGLAFVPFDSIWASFDNRLAVAKRALEVVQNDPILQNHPDRDFLLEHYQRLIGITIKAEKQSVNEVKEFIRNGFTTFRVYDARSRSRVEKIVKQIREQLSNDPEFQDILPKVTILAGQVSGPGQAERLQDAGVNGIIVGIGGGGICKTPKEASIHTTNVNVGRKILKAGIRIPVNFDGGIGPRMPVLLAMGGAAGLKSAALAGGCLEQPPYMYYYLLPGGLLGKNYAGEAAERTKEGGAKTDFLGRPLFVEGENEMTILNPAAPSMTDNTYYLLQSLVTAMIFARVDSIQGFHQMTKPDVWTATEAAKRRAKIHHEHSVVIKS